jgi:5S rRNA maturation endonuclease (ribonuclease M5)
MIDQIFEDIVSTYGGQIQSDGSCNIHCPADGHQDKTPSCNVKNTGDKILVHCFAGCSQDAVISALKSRNLWPEKVNGSNPTRPPGILPIWTPRGSKIAKHLTAWWEYKDQAGEIIGYTARYDDHFGDKDVIPYFNRSGGKWKVGGPKGKPIYGIEYLQGNDKPVLIVEGEKARDAAKRFVGKDYICISWMGGTGSVNKVDWTLIQGREVFIWPDNDEPGVKAAQTIQSKVPNARIITPPSDVPDKWDLADALKDGWTSEQVLQHIKTAAGNPGTDTGTTKPPFKLVKLSDVQMKPADWVANGLMEKDSLNQLFSDPGGCKTFLAIDLSNCVATGKDFHGRTVQQGPVVFIAGEGHNGIKRRFMAWEIHHQVALDKAPIFLSSMPAGLCDADQVGFVIEAIQAVADDHGQPVLIVLDTVARNFGSGDENSTRDMSGFIAGLDKIREKFRSCILLVHHTGHLEKSRARGSMALKGALDTEYRLEKVETDMIRMINTKMKDHQPPEPLVFKLNTVELPCTDEQGHQVTSAVLEAAQYTPPASKGKKGRGKWQTKAIEILKKNVPGTAGSVISQRF